MVFIPVGISVSFLSKDFDPQNFSYSIAGVVNFISATMAVSVFPRSTFLLRESKILRKVSDEDQWISKYKERGFKMIPDHEDGGDISELSGQRSAFDCKCWKIFFTGNRSFFLLFPLRCGVFN